MSLTIGSRLGTIEIAALIGTGGMGDQKDGRLLACELRDDGGAGAWEVQMSRDGEFLYSRPWATRALALEEADEQKARYLREGGVLIA